MKDVTARDFVAAVYNYRFLFNELRHGVPDTVTSEFLNRKLVQARGVITEYIQGHPMAHEIIGALEA